MNDHDEAPQRRARVPLIGAVAVLALGAAVTFVVVRPGTEAAGQTARTPLAATAQVERRTLQETITAPGSLTYGAAPQVRAGRAGTITELPRAGSRVKPGGALYAIDNQPVVLMRGTIPMWRPFKSGMSDGPDVRQLERNLAVLGHFTGIPDAHFDWYTKVAVQAWQRTLGVKQTGSIPRGQVVFTPGDVRVGDNVAHLGDQVGAGAVVVKLTALRKIVTAEPKAADQAVAKVRGKVTVNLPAGRTTTGTITRIGAPRQRDAQTKSIVIPVTIALDHPAAAGSLQEVSVSVDFPTASRKDVLTVPVAALIAQPGGGYGVEVAQDAGTTTVLPVKPGLFAGGFVEVTGDGLDAGQKVVVPTL